MGDEQPKPIDVITKNLSLISGCLIVCGIVKAITYYSVFQISILSYLELGECILLFLDDLLEAILAIGIIIVLSHFVNKPIIISYKAISIAVTLWISLSALILFLVKDYQITKRLVNGSCLLLGGSITFLIINRTQKKSYAIGNFKISYSDFLMLLIFLCIVATTGMQGFYDGMARKHLSYYKKNISIPYDNQTLVDLDSLNYLGKTNKYLFFWNREINTSIAIATDEIKQIEIK